VKKITVRSWRVRDAARMSTDAERRRLVYLLLMRGKLAAPPPPAAPKGRVTSGAA